MIAIRKNSVDVHVGRRVRELRHVRGLIPSQLAEILGVSVNCLLAYEAGEARISGGQLATLALAFGVPIGAFYEGIDAEGERTASRLH